MRIQIVRTGEILDLDNCQSIPNLEPFTVLNSSGIALDSRVFRIDSSSTVAEILDPLDTLIAQSRQDQMDRISSNGGKNPSNPSR